MTKLLFSVRITEKYFSTAQIECLERELDSFNSKSEFMRKIIKFYLKHNNCDVELEKNNVSTAELKKLLEENNFLLQQISSGRTKKIESNQVATAAYQGEKQTNKTNQALSLLEQF
ncbi:hypothetical protein [Halanaerobacter jeridensis]|uniref:Uncharacterized protein n=1 Tax=Halanaerobacter jeridensis TaxID=706427 RepID=A0A939BRM7_9FIRM|nr:hypothetical protein [Halanaerobacter jeridensis]MBM7557499.1 hypothetical protein [Halanaerobacter jeridensis]